METDPQPITPELWRVWEAKTRVRGKAQARKITLLASVTLVAAWLAGVITNHRLGGSIHILLFVAVAVLVVHLLQSRRSIL